MDLNYDISTWNISLQALSFVNVTYNIMEASRVSPSPTHDTEIIASRAIKRVQQQHWPPWMESEIIRLISPITLEWKSWYEWFGDRFQPVMTPYGTVDWVQSARSIIRTDISPFERFRIACGFCLEEDILLFGKQLPEEEKLDDCSITWGDSKFSALADFWFRIYNGQFDAPIVLSVEDCISGYNVAPNITSKKYFLEKAGKKFIDQIRLRLQPLSSLSERRNIKPMDSPLMICKFFEFFNGRRQTYDKGLLANALLLALLKWPYQHLFLQAARSLVDDLDSERYHGILKVILRKIQDNNLEHNYKGLFIGFCKIGIDQNRELLLVSKHLSTLVDQVLKMKDEIMTSFIIDEIPDLHKTSFLFSFNNKCLCSQMMRDMELEALEILVRVCQLKDKKLFAKFQNSVIQVHTSYQELKSEIYFKILNSNKQIQEFMRFMSKYKPLSEEVELIN